MRMHGCADAIKCTVHHLEGRDHADGTFCRLGASRVDQRLALAGRVAWPARSEGISDCDELSAERKVGRGSRRNRRKVKVNTDGVAARTEERCMGEQSIEALIEIARTSGKELDL